MKREKERRLKLINGSSLQIFCQKKKELNEM